MFKLVITAIIFFALGFVWGSGIMSLCASRKSNQVAHQEPPATWPVKKQALDPLQLNKRDAQKIAKYGSIYLLGQDDKTNRLEH